MLILLHLQATFSHLPRNNKKKTPLSLSLSLSLSQQQKVPIQILTTTPFLCPSLDSTTTEFLFSSCDQEKITTLLLLIAGAHERRNLLLPASILLIIIIIPTSFAMAIKHKSRTALFLWNFFSWLPTPKWREQRAILILHLRYITTGGHKMQTADSNNGRSKPRCGRKEASSLLPFVPCSHY
jgi:hypothetical protein